MNSACPRWLVCCGLILVVGLSSLAHPPAMLYAQDQDAEPAKSSDAAIRQYRAAVAFQNRQVYDLAIDEWKSFLEKFPQDPLAGGAQHYLGVCYFQQGKYAEAEAAFQAVLKDYPDFKRANETYLNLGLTQFNIGQSGDDQKLTAAAKNFQTLLEKFPEDKQAPLATYYQAEALYGAGKKKESVGVYQKFVEGYPEHQLAAKALYGLGVAQQETKDAAGATATYNKFLSQFADNPLATEIGMRLGDGLLAADKFAEAEKRFAEAAATEGFPLADYALLRLGNARFNQQKYAEAAAAYAQLIEQFPKSNYLADATLAAGQSYFLSGDHAKTREYLASDKLQGAAAQEAAHWVAKSYLKENKLAEALAAAEAALATAEGGPWHADLLLDQADAMYELADRRGESILLYAKLAADHPDHRVAPQAAYMAAYAALGQEKYEQALEHAGAFFEKHADHKLAPDVGIVQAESLLLLKKYAEAAAQYEELLAKYPDRKEANNWKVRTARAQQLAGKHDAVVALLTQQVDSLPAGPLRAEAQFLLASSYFEQKQFDKAIAAAKASLAADPKWDQADETTLILGRAQKQAGQIDAAIATLAALADDFPDSDQKTRAQFRLAEAQYAQGKYAEAAKAYQLVAERGAAADNNAQELVPYALFGLGWSHLSQQQYKPAAEAMSQLIEGHKQHVLLPRAHYARAVARQQTGEFSAALEDIDAFLASEPAAGDKADALYIRGLSQSGLKKFAEAAATFQSILESDPDYSAADKVLYELAWAHFEGKQPEKASAVFARLAAEHPDSVLAAEAFYRVGESQFNDEKYAEAVTSYSSALERAGKSDLGEKAAHKLAWAHFEQEAFDKAQAAYAAQLEQYPNGDFAADAQVMLGESLFEQEMYEEALAAYEKSQELDPSSDTFRVIALLHGGQSAARLEAWDKSLALLSECATKFPESDYKQQVLYEQAWALQNLGKNDEALKLYQSVADAGDNPVSARAQFMAGELYFLKKDYKEAIRVFFKVAYGYGYPDSPEPFHHWQANSTFEAARCFEMRKQTDQARKLYAELVDRYPNSDKAADAKKKIAALGG